MCECGKVEGGGHYQRPSAKVDDRGKCIIWIGMNYTVCMEKMIYPFCLKIAVDQVILIAS